MTKATNELLERLPDELKWTPHWCIAGYDKAPYSVHGSKLYQASNIKPEQWLDFETALDVASSMDAGIGYILTATDGFACIDLDVCDAESQALKGEAIDSTKWTTQEEFDRYWQMIQAFDSYTERSRSGKGFHIWVRGKIGKGCRRQGVEVYSQERFIICTGNIVVDKPIAARQDLLNILKAEMQQDRRDTDQDLIELTETEPDADIWQRAASANNDHKFIPLCEGKWADLGYPSQSEADLALMSMFTFYSKSNEQCRRMFRLTGLGQREKAVKNNRYLDFTLKRIRARQADEEIEISHGRMVGQALVDSTRGSVESLVDAMQAQRVAQEQANLNVPAPAPAAVNVAQMAPLPNIPDVGLPWPPGFVGAIAGFIYQSAPRPVKEVAIVAALGIIAGICGKAFSIPQSGLNLYIILVARSAIGKEAMHSGLSALVEALAARCPTATTFVDFNEFASGPALQKAVALNQSFLNVSGEWGRKLKRLAGESANDAPMQGLRTVMTNLYQKSGPASIVGGLSYSKKEENIASVTGVAYSMIGETTPKTYYQSLTESMMEDGFLSRFTIIEYDGERPEHNYNALREPDKALADALASIAIQALTLMSHNKRQDVGRDEMAGAIWYQFDKECDSQINSTDDESHRQMWNRAALKVLRISALLAVADNYIHPVIQEAHITWAIAVVRKDIGMMTRKFGDGDVGSGDNAREKKLKAICRGYLQGVADSYKIPLAMVQAGIIPRKFLQLKISSISSFTTHRNGAIIALDSTLRSLVDNGSLMEIPKAKLITDYKFHGKSYQILNID